MDIFINQLSKHLIKYYNIRAHEVESIVEDEWDYLEEEYIDNTLIEDVAQNLINFYMVA